MTADGSAAERISGQLILVADGQREESFEKSCADETVGFVIS
jgi:hypothetical protein